MKTKKSFPQIPQIDAEKKVTADCAINGRLTNDKLY
jgi:hypothetical protein